MIYRKNFKAVIANLLQIRCNLIRYKLKDTVLSCVFIRIDLVRV